MKKILLIFIMLFMVTSLYTKNVSEEVNVPTIGFMNNLTELKEISDIMDVIILNFVGEKDIDKKELLHGAIKGMMDSLDDPHSVYFPEKEMKSFSEDMKGEYAGVGMVVTKKDNYLTVVSPIDETPAYKAGMKPNDKIISIEDVSTFDLTLEQCVEKLKGKPNTKVKINVLREERNERFDVELVRSLIKLKYVKHSMIDNEIGYIKLTQFSENVGKDVQKSLDELVGKNMKGLVFDLRYNPGGSLKEAIDISSLFVDKNPIVTVKDRSNTVEKYDRKGKAYTGFPLVVLINGGSASASEIVSGAIKDHKRGLLVGEKTFGKGSVQNLVPLNDGDALKLTIAKYYTPSGESIHKKGIEPDIYVKESSNFIPFDGTITNIVSEETDKKSDKKDNVNKKKIEKNKVDKSEENKEKTVQEENTENKINKPEDIQLNTAINILKGILIHNNNK